MTERAVRELIVQGSSQLEAAHVPSPRVDAELLMAHTLGVERSQLIVQPSPSDEQIAEYLRLIGRRSAREPLQHLTGRAYFRHLELEVGPGVFIPRPETETLVDLVLTELKSRREAAVESELLVVDLCTGSAAIPLAIATECRAVSAVAVELSPDAFAWAQRNVVAHRDQLEAMGSRIELIRGDACDAAAILPADAGRADVVTCNPPYIPDGAIPRDPEVRDHDPAIALFGGADGLDIVRRVVEQAAKLLRPGGLLLIEHGDEQGFPSDGLGVPGVVARAPEFEATADHADLAGRPRVTTTRLRSAVPH